MFYRLKQFFRFKERRKIIYDNNYELKLLTIKVESLKDDITLLKKIVKRKETKLLVSRIDSIFSFNTSDAEECMEAARDKLKSDGFSFCHRHPNGNETWAKD